MAEVWVVNASPVIVLAKAGYLHLLEQLAGEVLLPGPVVAEVLAGPPSDPGRHALETGWGIRVDLAESPAELLEWGLGPGETAVLAAARERPSSAAVVDDAAARACAKAIGVPVIGTLGVALRARKRQLVPSAREVIEALVTAGLYVEHEMARLALQSVGENWD